MDSEEIKKNALLNKKANNKFYNNLRKKNPRLVDKVIHAAHEKVFACTDCLKCANCCKTTSPFFTNKDISRISKHFRLKEVDFVEQYLKIDEDNDYVLQKTPCTFLGEDNACSIYDIRPKACREFPHTDQPRQTKYFTISLINTQICPAVNDIIEEVKKTFDPVAPTKGNE